MEAGTVPRVAAPRIPTPGPRLIRIASDARLVSLVREGRAGAFEAVYDRHHRGILSFCRHMLGDQHEAEDALQHTFMAAYSSLLANQRPIHLRPWLFAIARNRCYSVLRSQRERPTAEIEEPITDGLAAEVQRRQDLRDLVNDLHQLPNEQREAIVLAELDCLSHAEIGEVLGVPRDKVKALVFQARESLLASRTARDTSCHEIRQQLAVGRGAALRRGNLRRHLRDCEGCRAYRTQVQHQRRQFALLLPIGPTLLAKEGLLAAAVGTGGAVAASGTGLIASSALKTGLLKGVAAAVIAGVGTLGTVVVSASNLPVRTFEAGGSAHHGAVHRSASPHPTVIRSSATSSAGSYLPASTSTVAGSRAGSGHHARTSATGRAHAHGKAAATRGHGRGSAHRHTGVRGHGHGRAAAGGTGAGARAGHVYVGHSAPYVANVPPGWTHRSQGGLPPGQAKKLAHLASSRTAHGAVSSGTQIWARSAASHRHGPKHGAGARHGHTAGGLPGHVQFGVTRHVAGRSARRHIQWGVTRHVAGRSARRHIQLGVTRHVAGGKAHGHPRAHASKHGAGSDHGHGHGHGHAHH